MKEVAISEFKAKCLGMLEQVRKTRKPIRITRFGKPVAEVIPPISRGANRPEAWIHGRNRRNCGRHRWPYRKLGRLGSFSVKLLLDTHIWLWSALEPQRLPAVSAKHWQILRMNCGFLRLAWVNCWSCSAKDV